MKQITKAAEKYENDGDEFGTLTSLTGCRVKLVDEKLSVLLFASKMVVNTIDEFPGIDADSLNEVLFEVAFNLTSTSIVVDDETFKCGLVLLLMTASGGLVKIEFADLEGPVVWESVELDVRVVLVMFS